MNTYPDFSSQNYQVIRELGRNREGGRISFLAESVTDKQQVVIKQFRFVQENASWEGFKVYEREISILQALNHPRIPRYLDSFETGDGFCMVQEYKAATTLAMRKSFEPEAIQQIAISVLEILVDLQKRVPPIFHRDIKPENILVDKNNQAYLIDFGLARVNSQEVALSSVMAGTPGFMPPEELFNRPLTTASDLYSLGATLISLITNTSAVEISRLMDENYQFQFRHLVKEINLDFVNWLQKMVAPNAKDRFNNAAAALQELRNISITGKAKFQPQNDLQKYLAVVGTVIASFGAIIFFGFSSVNQGYSPVTNSPSIPASSLTAEEQWFNQIKPSCNSVEVVTAMSGATYPQTPQGVGYAASCYALAGRIDLADQVILQLPPNNRVYAAAIVFNIGHPVADAGDDKSAGLIMNLVLRYWPDNYMALFHAGMSEYILNDYPQSQSHLQSFLRVYQQQDGWTDKAKSALNRMENGISADQSFKIRE
ncbi:MAG: serine/threonine protein kinase [Anaerolineae bacterium]|nr:serine/threonine protein kinase [Gloeobacterales cyanobacterium ES-bin-313]